MYTLFSYSLPPAFPYRLATLGPASSTVSFQKIHVCFCCLDPGNLKFETVRTNKQHICF